MAANTYVRGYFSDDEISLLKVSELKKYLRQHGQYVTGQKKELTERAKGVRKLGLQDIDVRENNESAMHEIRNKEKLTTPLGEIIPDPMSLKSWSSDMSNVPNFFDIEIYNYLVLTMKAKRQFRSKVYFEDRHVHSLQYHPVSDDCSHCLVKCKVIPSIPTTNKKHNPDHDVWVLLSKVSGKVHSANCNCTAGTGEACNHISALLYSLEDVSLKKKDGTLSSTSQKCKWNNPRKRKLSPKKVQDLRFNKFCYNQHNSFESKTSENFENSSTSAMKPTINVDRLKQKLFATNASIAWLTYFEESVAVKEIQTVPRLHNVEYMFHDGVDFNNDECQKDFKDKFQRMVVSEEDVLKIEKLTDGQNKNNEWHSARNERITSSNFGSVCKLRADTKPDNTLKSMWSIRI